MKLESLRPAITESFDTEEVRYHKDIGFPDDLVLPRGFKTEIDLKYGSHAQEESIKDKYGLLQLPRRIDVRRVEIFEVSTNPGSNVIKKICVRMTHDAKKDIIIVILVPEGRVKTVWANLKTDNHRTLNRSNYADPNARQQRLHA